MKHSKLIYSLTFFGWLLLDQVSKYLIDASMYIKESMEIIPGFFRITYVTNTGSAWSMLEGQMNFFYCITIAALIVMAYFFKTCDKKDFFTRLGLISMIAGTIGNFIDRICFQHVRDFLDFMILGYDFPVFNIADVALCIGVFLIFVSVIIENYGGNRICEK